MPKQHLFCTRCGAVIASGDERYRVGVLCARCWAVMVRRLGDAPTARDLEDAAGRDNLDG